MAIRIELRTTPIRFEDGDQVGTPAHGEIDLDGLKADLSARVGGEVRFDAGSRGMYAHDGGNYRMVPIGVVIPRSDQDVEAAVAVARKHGVPLVARGGGTGIPGQSVNAALMIDFSKYLNDLVSLDPEKCVARVRPGIILDKLRAAAEKHKLTFGPDPATHSRNTLGGMIGNNSCGPHSVMAGRTADNIEELEILLYDGTRMRVGRTSDAQLEEFIAAGGREGQIYARLKALRDKYADRIRDEFPRIPRRVSGFNLDELLPEKGFNVARALVGTECTCALVLEATCRLMPSPQARSLLVLGFSDVAASGDYVPEALKFRPIACEGMDDTFIEDMKRKGLHPRNLDLMPAGRAWLMVEFGGKDKGESDANARKMMEDLKKRGDHAPSMKLFDDPAREKFLWHLREEGLGATAWVPGEKPNHEGWEDAAVPPDKVGAYLRDFRDLMNRYEYRGALYGHFGDGCVHTRLDFDLETRDGIAKYRRFVQEAADMVHRYGGSLSGEHGDGQARGELLTRMYSREIVEAFREFKEIWDPDWKMNPGKVIAPYRVGENLVLGPNFDPPKVKTHFAFPDDRHDWNYATRRCVGAGVCRRHDGGTMCPSYMVTHEEKHSTRGRARLLYEMMQGDPVKGGWKSEEVKEALDLCLSCKGCKHDCPVQVDMATYKAEFLSHYFEGRVRPRHAYAFGWIQIWSRIASQIPQVVNFVTHAPLFSALAKKASGMAPRRSVPAFAAEPFRLWWTRRRQRGGGTQAPARRGRVLLWTDTFNNYFHPTTAQAAVEVLEHAGFRVDIPAQNLCCGRPLYDYGFLDMAKGYLRRTLDALRDDIRAGTPIVVLEPSCATVFRDELTNMFPDDEDAKRLSGQVFLLSELLQKKAPDYKPPRLKRTALVHGHCHHKSIMGMGDEEALLKAMGVEYQMPDTGCCGMAGAFGFEEGDHYDVSLKCGERVLLPAVRDSADDTLIVADGFSCREQIKQETRREALHLAQVLKMAIEQEEHVTAPAEFPECRYVNEPPEARRRSAVRTGVILGTAAAIGLCGTLWLRHRGGKA